MYFLTLFAVLASTAGSALGQSAYRRPDAPQRPYFQPVPTWPVELGFSYHHASTAQEGAERGAAEVIQAQGNYLLSASQAEVLNQQARGMALDNRQLRIEHLTSLRAWREADRQNRIAQKRVRNLARREAREQAAYRLSSDQVNQDSH